MAHYLTNDRRGADQLRKRRRDFRNWPIATPCAAALLAPTPNQAMVLAKAVAVEGGIIQARLGSIADIGEPNITVALSF